MTGLDVFKIFNKDLSYVSCERSTQLRVAEIRFRIVEICLGNVPGSTCLVELGLGCSVFLVERREAFDIRLRLVELRLHTVHADTKVARIDAGHDLTLPDFVAFLHGEFNQRTADAEGEVDLFSCSHAARETERSSGCRSVDFKDLYRANHGNRL